MNSRDLVNELNVIYLPVDWELWFLNDTLVYSGHNLDALDLLEMIPLFGNYVASHVQLGYCMEEPRYNIFALRSDHMPKTFQELKDMLTDEERTKMVEQLEENRSTT